MPLFDPDRTVDVDPADQVRIVHAFLERCEQWAKEREIPKRIDRVAASSSPEDAAKLHAWVSYLRFCEHARDELESGTLDHWFAPH